MRFVANSVALATMWSGVCGVHSEYSPDKLVKATHHKAFVEPINPHRRWRWRWLLSLSLSATGPAAAAAADPPTLQANELA